MFPPGIITGSPSIKEGGKKRNISRGQRDFEDRFLHSSSFCVVKAALCISAPSGDKPFDSAGLSVFQPSYQRARADSTCASLTPASIWPRQRPPSGARAQPERDQSLFGQNLCAGASSNENNSILLTTSGNGTTHTRVGPGPNGTTAHSSFGFNGHSRR